jgi:hypothetical protein
MGEQTNIMAIEKPTPAKLKDKCELANELIYSKSSYPQVFEAFSK